MNHEPPHCDPCFPETRWTLIQRLRSGDETISRPALAELCVQYHFPLYCFIRRRGLDHHDAEDALQDFFAKLLRLESFATADPEKGRLRSYLATALHRFLIDWRKSEGNHRRSDFQPCTPQGDALRLRYENAHTDASDSPETILDRRWAHALMSRVLTNLREIQTARGKARLFEAIDRVSTGSVVSE
jgi:DNA-directed RNA polymerase specialized sigma24 family protein